MPRVAWSLLVLAVAAGCATPAGAPADLVLHNAVLWSPGEAPGFASGLAVRDGRIIAVGDVAALVGSGTRAIDLGGAMVLPGFQDSHMHAMWGSGNTPFGVFAGAAFERPLVPGYQPSSAAQQRVGDEATFQAQTALHGHRHALYAAQGEDAETGFDVCAASDPARVEAVAAAYREAEVEMAAQGITTVVDAMFLDMTNYEALKRLEAANESRIRWLLRVVPGCYEHMDAMGVGPETDSEWVRLFGVKLYGDGFMGGWVAALDEPYSDRPGWNGIRVYSDAALDGLIGAARERGLNVGTHAIGDATIEQVLEAYARLGVTPEDRWTVEHAQVTNPALIERFADLGVIASIQLSFATTDQRMAGDRLGAERTAAAYNWSGFLDAGAPLAGGSDYPIEVITPLWGLQRETTRMEVDGTPAGGWFPENGLTLDEALTSITRGVAYVASEEHERGALRVGHVADLVVVRENLFTLPPERIASATILLTMVNGKITFDGERSYPPQT